MHLLAPLFLQFKKLLNVGIFPVHLRVLMLNFVIANQDGMAFWDLSRLFNNPKSSKGDNPKKLTVQLRLLVIFLKYTKQILFSLALMLISR